VGIIDMKHSIAAIAFLLVLLSSSGFAAESSPASANGNWVQSLPSRHESKLLAAEHSSINVPAACCKVCTKGKPCGDTCISQDKICHVGPGCAC
jgi:hypothetical protein